MREGRGRRRRHIARRPAELLPHQCLEGALHLGVLPQSRQVVRKDYVPYGREEAAERVSMRRISHAVLDVRDDVLDRAERRAGELEGPFDLEAVHGRELCEDDEGADLHNVCQLLNEEGEH